MLCVVNILFTSYNSFIRCNCQSSKSADDTFISKLDKSNEFNLEYETPCGSDGINSHCGQIYFDSTCLTKQ